MSWKMHDDEYKDVLSLKPEERYSYFLEKVADWEEIWSLSSGDDFALLGDDQNNELFPVWPHPIFTKPFTDNLWDDCEPKLIDIHFFIEKWIPGMISIKKLISVFPIIDVKGKIIGTILAPDKLKKDLETEIQE